VALFALQITQVWAGTQGVDFAIFAQMIDRASHDVVLETSLLGHRWVNFLTHHFSPIYYLPALLTWLGIPAPYSALTVQMVSITLMMVVTFVIALRGAGGAARWRSCCVYSLIRH
jgi:hypothetical protein